PWAFSLLFVGYFCSGYREFRERRMDVFKAATFDRIMKEQRVDTLVTEDALQLGLLLRESGEPYKVVLGGFDQDDFSRLGDRFLLVIAQDKPAAWPERVMESFRQRGYRLEPVGSENGGGSMALSRKIVLPENSFYAWLVTK